LFALLCDRVVDVPFEGEQEKVYEEEFQQLAKEVKWTSPLHILFDPNNIMIIHLTLFLKLHKLDGNTY